MSPYFEELKVGQFYSPELHNIVFNPATEWIPYFNFIATPIPNEVLFKDNFYKWLHDRHSYKAGVLKMENRTMYNWHTDTGRNTNYRKISLSVQLSNSDEYNGGIFELGRNGLFNEPKHLKKGNAIMFPSLLRHRILPITAGIRKSLVVWIAGPHIK